jgi:hypothetical protein
MGYRLNILDRDVGYSVSLSIALSREESNDLFLSGDSMLSWPTDTLVDEGPAPSRVSIFISEVAARNGGLVLLYLGREQAEMATKLLQLQLEQVGIAREEL